MRVGVLALQGAFLEHLKVLRSLGVDARDVRRPEEMRELDGLILPGGESTTIGMLMERFGLTARLLERARRGMPVWGTCAGMILMARRIEEGLPSQVALGLLDASVRRNAFGRQIESFTASLKIPVLGGEPFPAVFIRAPQAVDWGATVEVLAEHQGRAVALRQGAMLATSFHPELSGDTRFHRWFLDEFVKPASQSPSKLESPLGNGVASVRSNTSKDFFCSG